LTALVVLSDSGYSPQVHYRPGLLPFHRLITRVLPQNLRKFESICQNDHKVLFFKSKHLLEVGLASLGEERLKDKKISTNGNSAVS
jgi:hypothetical protein